MRRLSRFPGLTLLFACALALCGCGYSFTGSTGPDASGTGNTANRLPLSLRNINLVRVDNPTTESWLEPRLRSLIRDEFNRRRLVTWTERAKATALLTVIVKKYTRETTVSGQQSQSVKLRTGITWQVRVNRAADGKIIWDSGEQSQGESFYPGDADGADQRVTDMAVRRLADLMTENY